MVSAFSNTDKQVVKLYPVNLAQIYSSWYHLNRLSAGLHTLIVTLNANNHEEYAADGCVIKDTDRITAR